jgi:hypothetical protein
MGSACEQRIVGTYCGYCATIKYRGELGQKCKLALEDAEKRAEVEDDQEETLKAWTNEWTDGESLKLMEQMNYCYHKLW